MHLQLTLNSAHLLITNTTISKRLFLLVVVCLVYVVLSFNGVLEGYRPLRNPCNFDYEGRLGRDWTEIVFRSSKSKKTKHESRDLGKRGQVVRKSLCGYPLGPKGVVRLVGGTLRPLKSTHLLVLDNGF